MIGNRGKDRLHHHAPSGSRPKTIPCTTVLLFKLLPMILTTRTLSTLKFFGFGGMTARDASATSAASLSSTPYCFEAIAGRRAVARDDVVNGEGRVLTESSGGRLVEGMNALRDTHSRAPPAP